MRHFLRVTEHLGRLSRNLGLNVLYVLVYACELART